MRKLSGVMAIAVAVLALGAAPAAAHDGEGGEPAHMGTTAGDDLVHWHDHPMPWEAEAQREASRQNVCATRLSEWLREWRNADDADAYAYDNMMADCADQETPVGKHICEGAQRDYESNRAGLLAGIQHHHQRAAEICTPEEMQAALGNQ